MKMKKVLLLVTLCGCFFTLRAQEEIRLLVRVDDMASFHAANEAIIETCTKGIARSAEVMVTCSWFLEAARMLREHPNIDAGVHLVLTSEWENNKWRPLTQAPSLVDSNGYFFPQVRKNPAFPPNSSIEEAKWNIKEIEQELRAQIELAMKHIPQISHVSIHMGFTGLHPDINQVCTKLCEEYGLRSGYKITGRFNGWGNAATLSERIDAFCKSIEELKPGTYLYVEHPAYNVSELQTISFIGYGNVAINRGDVTAVLTSPKVKAMIEKKKVKLIGYNDD